MSRHLPSRPNLDHLRKQAKDLLSDIQKGNPGWKLADAQHALARGYGFASWPKLKSHVELLASGPTDPDIEPVRRSERQGDEVDPPGNDGATRGSDSEEENPFAGTWTANLPKSEQHPANPFQSATLDFTVVGNTATIAQVFVDASGHEVGGRMTIQADGSEHPSEYGNGHALIARWIGSHILEAIDVKDGQILGRGLYEVSGDGKTLTVSTNEQRIVLDRR
jgi:hypothetical protein